MPIRKPVDHRPGPPPDIRATSNSVTFDMEIARVPDNPRLIIRCDADGSVWVSIVTEP